MDQREDFKNLAKSIRGKFNWTQSEMAKMLGVTQAAVCKWEKRGSISVINYLKLQELKGSSVSSSAFIAAPTDNNEQQQHHSHS
ncbi:helix-turn-helix transcriptional regulator [Bartonella vinsonii]|uniref:Antitoxin HipB n=1 Tax=Bartonella vinsonii TaxID=33047 RepID=A0A448V8P3_BARVI|nr:helix-turn-helix transcriptional regulator [Bartonella vinsonii]VEJ45992.1 antitoxin HipB [Bartonella vinsonii]VEJ46144.1 antitoxin HipB [Bartonella vinsonii]